MRGEKVQGDRKPVGRKAGGCVGPGDVLQLERRRKGSQYTNITQSRPGGVSFLAES